MDVKYFAQEALTGKALLGDPIRRVVCKDGPRPENSSSWEGDMQEQLWAEG